MAPSAEVPCPAEGRFFGYKSLGEIILPPAETVTDSEQIKSLSEQLLATPQAIFRFPLIDSGPGQEFGHLELVDRLCDFGRYHPTTGKYSPKVLEWGEEYREYLFRIYQTQLIFDYTGPASIRILPETERATTLSSKDSVHLPKVTFDPSIQISPGTERATTLSYGELLYLLGRSRFVDLVKNNQALHALLALNEGQQEMIFEAANQSSLAFLFVVKQSTLVGKTEMLEPADGILIRKEAGERDYLVRDFPFPEAQRRFPQSPFFVALEGSS